MVFGGRKKQQVPGTLLQHIHDMLATHETMVSYTCPRVVPQDYGDSPSCTMEIKFHDKLACPGFPVGGGTIVITYDIPSGTQMSYHYHPGRSYDGDRRPGFLPNTPEGRVLLTRFRYALKHGHMFKVGRSISSGKEDQVTWTTIPNKTSLKGGPFGFPDPSYLAKAHAELDKIGIPGPDECLDPKALTNSTATPTPTPTLSLPPPLHVPQQRTGLQGRRRSSSNKAINLMFPVVAQTIVYKAPAKLGTTPAVARAFESISRMPASQSSNGPSAPPLPPAFSPGFQSARQASTSLDDASAPPLPTLRPLPPPMTSSPNPSPSAPTATASMAISQSQMSATADQTQSPVPAANRPAVLALAPPSMVPWPSVTMLGTKDDDDDDVGDANSATNDKKVKTCKRHNQGWLDDTECAVCLDPLSSQPAVRIKNCGHCFHHTCIMDAVANVPNCPLCQQPVSDEPQGKCPSGTMKIELEQNRPCPGFESEGNGVIEIIYDIPDGTQFSYHDHPGQRYDGTTRVAYLPATLAGRKLLSRLVYAWKHGLTFRIGTSLTTGQDNQITWTSIHHKTSLHGGVHGFPDPNYIMNCNRALDALSVPQAEDCI